jgi:hypothetical protein
MEVYVVMGPVKGPEVGAFNAEVYQGLLGLAADQLEKLREQGVI